MSTALKFKTLIKIYSMRIIRQAKYFLSFVFILVGLNSSFAQSDWKNWDGLGLNLGFTKKTEMELNHLRAYDMNQSFRNTFNQWGINLDHDIAKKLSVKAGYKLTSFPSGSVAANRFLARATYKIRLAKVINWSNGLQGEVNTASGKGNFYRVIYITRFAPRKRLNFLRLSPSVSYWLYYNIGGNSIQYFDEGGSQLAKETPDGIHRGRFILNLNSRINNRFSLSLYYLNQHEFNLVGRDINIIDPDTGKIEKPFNNFQVAGLSLAFSLDFYKRKDHQKNKNN